MRLQNRYILSTERNTWKTVQVTKALRTETHAKPFDANMEINMINYLLCRWVHRNKLLTRQMTNKKVFWQLHEEMVKYISIESEESPLFCWVFFNNCVIFSTIAKPIPFRQTKLYFAKKNLDSLDFPNASELRKDNSKTHFLKYSFFVV